MIRREIEIARKKAEEEARKKAEEERKKQLAAAAAAKPPTMRVGDNPPTTTTTTPATTTTTTPDKPASSTTVAPVERTPRPVANKPVANLSLTPEAAALASNFEANRGRLPWPVEKGFISDRFGVHPHAIERKVNVENNGVSIRTSDGAVARAVF